MSTPVGILIGGIVATATVLGTQYYLEMGGFNPLNYTQTSSIKVADTKVIPIQRGYSQPTLHAVREPITTILNDYSGCSKDLPKINKGDAFVIHDNVDGTEYALVMVARNDNAYLDIRYFNIEIIKNKDVKTHIAKIRYQ